MDHDGVEGWRTCRSDGPLILSTTTMRAPLRRFSSELLGGGRKKTNEKGVEVEEKEKEQGRGLARWPKLFKSQLRVTSPSRSVLDLRLHSTSPPTRTASPSSVMSDFLSRENELLGGSFSPPSDALGGGGGAADIDLDAAASAFPDISLDGSGDLPTPAPASSQPMSNGFDFDDFDEPVREVKVTGDDEIERFEDQFPDIGEASPVRTLVQVGCA